MTLGAPARSSQSDPMRGIGNEGVERGCRAGPVGIERGVRLMPVIADDGAVVIDKGPPSKRPALRTHVLEGELSRTVSGVTNPAPDRRSTSALSSNCESCCDKPNIEIFDVIADHRTRRNRSLARG